jgi:O-antigen ligase
MSALLVGVFLAHSVQLGIALLAAVLFLPLALLNLPVAIALWVPLAYLEAWPAASRIPAGVAILLGLAWIGTIAGGRSLASEVFRRHRGTYVLLLALLSWITLSLFWAQDPTAGANGLYVWYWAAAIAIVVPTALSTRRHLTIVCIGFTAAALISVVIALPQLSTTPSATDDVASRLGGSLQNPNYLAAALLSAAALMAGLIAVAQRPAQKRFLMVALGVVALAIFATGSRGGLVAAVLMVVAALVLTRRRRINLGAIIAVALAVGTLWIGSSDRSLSRLREFDTSGSGRADLWNVALRMWEDHPVLGVGYLNFAVESPRYLLQPGQISAEFVIDQPKETHNAYLGLLAETGVIGLALFVALVISLMRATWLAARRLEEAGDTRYATLGRAVLIAQIGSLVALMFSHNPYNHPFWLLLAMGPVLLTIAARTSPGDHPT